MRLIDADAFERNMQNEWERNEISNGEWIHFREMINAEPTIEERTGRWIHDGYAFKGGIDWMHCSECGHKDSWSVATRTPFCAWCGAKMEVEHGTDR